jgi:hypothetical protein
VEIAAEAERKREELAKEHLLHTKSRSAMVMKYFSERVFGGSTLNFKISEAIQN